MNDNYPEIAYRGYHIHLFCHNRWWSYLFIDNRVRFQEAGNFADRESAVKAAKDAVDADLENSND